MIDNISGWKFDAEVANVFNDHIKVSVPMYEEIHQMVTELSRWFIEDGTTVYDIGTSTGQAIASLYECHKHKNVKFIGIDSSEDMIKKAQERFSQVNNIGIIHADIADSPYTIRNASFIVSILTMMFVPQRKRLSVFKEIYDGLNENSAFVLVEKVIGESVKTNEMWIELYHDMKLRNNLTYEEIFNKTRSIRGILKPFTLNQNIRMLKQVGFNNIDVFFKWYNFAGLIAVK